MKQRYFLISYRVKDGEGFLTDSASNFPSHTKIIDAVNKQRKANYKEVAIVSIFEFKNKKDFDSFNK